jgi:hypothetical protein
VTYTIKMAGWSCLQARTQAGRTIGYVKDDVV